MFNEFSTKKCENNFFFLNFPCTRVALVCFYQWLKRKVVLFGRAKMFSFLILFCYFSSLLSFPRFPLFLLMGKIDNIIIYLSFLYWRKNNKKKLYYLQEFINKVEECLLFETKGEKILIFLWDWKELLLSWYFSFMCFIRNLIKFLM